MSVSTVAPSSGRPLRSVDGTGRKKVAVPSGRNRSHWDETLVWIDLV